MVLFHQPSKSINLEPDLLLLNGMANGGRSQGQAILKDGKPLPNDQENIAELTKQALEFEQKQLPILKALEIAI